MPETMLLILEVGLYMPAKVHLFEVTGYQTVLNISLCCRLY